MHKADIVIVGAGVAGLAAAAALRARHLSVIVLEAGSRAGGRARTLTPPALAGEPCDLGASWFHAATTNPLAALAASHNRPTTAFTPTLFPAPSPDRMQAETLFTQAAEAGAHGQDASLLETIRRGGPENPWFPTIATLEGAIIAGADAADLSHADWAENELDDHNLWPTGGAGAFVDHILRPQAGPIELNWPVATIDWNPRGGGVAIAGPRGALTAAACIVTVSTGVLASGAIRFPTPLPHATQAALDALPMGLLTKLFFRPAAPDLLALAADTSIQQRVAAHGDPAMLFLARPNNAAHVMGACGGSTAWHLARQGPAAHVDFAAAQLAAVFGARARAWIPPEACIVTDWASDPLFAGAYSYGRPGCGEARSILAEPIGEGRLCFAGEACHRGVAGTLQAAWLSGRAAATHAARVLTARP